MPRRFTRYDSRSPSQGFCSYLNKSQTVLKRFHLPVTFTNGGFYLSGVLLFLIFVFIEFVNDHGSNNGITSTVVTHKIEKHCGHLKKEIERLKSITTTTTTDLHNNSSNHRNRNNYGDKEDHERLLRQNIRRELLMELKSKNLLKEDDRLKDSIGNAFIDISERSSKARSVLKLPPCAEKNNSERANSFLMVFMGHSGSSAILSEMGQHKKIFVTIPEPVDHGIYEMDTKLALNYADEFFSNGTRFGKIAGFKMRPFHIMQNPKAWRDLVKKHKTRIIWQYRANIFKQAVGEYTHEYLGDKDVIEGLRDGYTLEQRCKSGKCRFKIENLDRLHNLLVKFYTNDEQIKTAVQLLSLEDGTTDGCVLPVAYEDYLYGRENVMRQIHAFMGVPYEDHPPTRRKATKDNMCDAVENFDEVCNGFYGCAAWRWMMDDHINGCKCTQLSPSKFSQQQRYCQTSPR